MAIAFDASSSETGNGVASVTFAHTCAGSNRLLVVALRTDDNEPTGVTYNGVAMTNLWSGDNRNSAWYLKAPATGANNIVVTFGGNTSNIVICACSFFGVDQTTPVDVPCALTSVFGTSVNANVSSAANDWVVDVLYCNQDPAPDGAQTGRVETDRFGSYLSMSTKPGEAICNMAWTWVGDSWGRMRGVSINPAAAVGGIVVLRRRRM